MTRAMAALAHTSPRHLGRLFSEHTGTTPLNYLRQIRLAVAEAALNAGHNVTQAAALSGFGSDTQLRRAWQHLSMGLRAATDTKDRTMDFSLSPELQALRDRANAYRVLLGSMVVDVDAAADAAKKATEQVLSLLTTK